MIPMYIYIRPGSRCHHFAKMVGFLLDEYKLLLYKTMVVVGCTSRCFFFSGGGSIV